MPYLIANPTRTVFEVTVHHFSNSPTGPRLVQSPTSRMVVACAPWSRAQELLANLGSMFVAAYVLAGAQWPEGIVSRCYVGETADITKRLRDHANDPAKTFVTEVFVIGSRDVNYEKTDVQMLQYLLDARIEEQDRAWIIRGVRPALPKIDTERRNRSVQDFNDVRRLLPAAGCNLLDARGRDEAEPTIHMAGERRLSDRNAERLAGKIGRAKAHPFGLVSDDQILRPDMNEPAKLGNAADGPRLQLFTLLHAGLVAYGYQDHGEFVVLPGSQMRRSSVRSFDDDVANQQRRRDIVDAQVVAKVKAASDRWRLVRERRFPSRAIAAKVLMGCNLTAEAWTPVAAESREA